ncbi:hypothetical protein ACWEQJ_22035, partial [Streptomyces cyaneofuscatus]
SHTWARGVPGVTYCRDIGEIHDALVHLAQEGQIGRAHVQPFVNLKRPGSPEPGRFGMKFPRMPRPA